MAATRLIPLHINKGHTLAKCLSDRIDYANNPDKTEQYEHVSSYQCDYHTAAQEFLLSKSVYAQRTGRSDRSDVIAYQIRQSFKPGEITPEEANKIGYELALRFTKGRHAFVVCTHTDRAHIHNHIIFNSTSLDCTSKFRNFFRSSYAIQRISDHLCLEHGLSVIEPRPHKERRRQTSCAGRRRDHTRGDFRLLIDIQEKLRQGKGTGYARWAKRFNLKQMAKVLVYLQEQGINDYEELVQRTDDATARYDQLTTSIRHAEDRLNEIVALKRHILNYSKTKDIYAEYRRSGYSKQFYEEHQSDLALHQAAKDAFNQLDGKVPRIKDLNAEYTAVLEQKKRDYAEYKDARAAMRQLVLARRNVELLLELDENQVKYDRKQAQTRA